MKKILFLIRSFPNTLGSATILCSHRVIKCTADSGKFEVHVLCYRYPHELKEEKIGGIYVHRFEPSCWTKMRNYLFVNRKHLRLNRIFEIIQKTITIPAYPKKEPLTTELFYKTANRLYNTLCYDLVISEHHGLSSLLTGCKLMKNIKELKHVALMWDPLKGEMATMKLPASFTNRRIDLIEKYVSDYTTLQISFSSMRDYHLKNGDIAADHRVYLGVPSILEPEEEVETEYLGLIKKNDINIVFSGLLSQHYRDALPIIRLLNLCDCAERINLVFFSRGQKEQVEQEAKNFRGTVVYHDYIPLSELHTMYRHADYLLNVSHINANMVPSKIFEYMSYGKPIISTYITEGDSAAMFVRQYPEGICVDLKMSDKENLMNLNNFFNREHKSVSFEIVKKKFEEETPEKYFEVINNVCIEN